MKPIFRIRFLRTKILLLFSTVTLLSVTVTAGILIRISGNTITKSLGQQSVSIAESITASINNDIPEIETMIQSAGTASEDSGKLLFEEESFRNAAKWLNGLRQKTGLKYLYILAEDSGGIYYALDGSEPDDEEYAYPGSRENTDYPGMRRLFAEQKTIIEPVTFTEEEGALLSAYVPIRNSEGRMIGALGADFDAGPAYHGIGQLYRMFFLLLGVSLTLTFAAAFLFSLKTFRALEILSQKIQEASAGNLTVSVAAESADETGRIASAFTNMIRSLEEIIHSVKSMGSAVEGLTTEIARSTGELSRSARDIRSQIEEVAVFAKETVVDSKVTLYSVDELSASLSEIQQSAGEISDQSARSADQAKLGNSTIQKAIHQMNTISQSVERSVQMIDELDKRSAEIGEIVKTITGISEQTNMLALNASIEAARAGDQGRGFAIVADQVNKLADQSSLSARQIAHLISEIQKETRNSVESMDDVTKEVIEGINVIYSAGKAFETIVISADNLKERLTALNEVTLRMTHSMEEVSRSIHSMTEAARHSMMMFEFIAKKTGEQEAGALEISNAAGSARELATGLSSSLWKFTVSDSGSPSGDR